MIFMIHFLSSDVPQECCMPRKHDFPNKKKKKFPVRTLFCDSNCTQEAVSANPYLLCCGRRSDLNPEPTIAPMSKAAFTV
jgi:hypothetical protein